MIRFTFGYRYKVTYTSDEGERETAEVNYAGSPYPGILEFAHKSRIDLQLWREQIIDAERIGDAVWK